MDYIKEAKRYYEIALKELKEASENGKIELAVNGCDKGWLSTVLATNALFIKKGEPEEKLPETHRGRRYLLTKYGTKELRTVFYKARDVLHIDGFYDRLIDYKVISETMEDIKEYIDKIEKS